MSSDLNHKVVSQTPRVNNGREWTTAELQVLRAHAHEGAAAIAILLGRTERSVRSTALRLRISLRRRGERRGLILGQPRGESWANLRAHGITPEVIDALRAGHVDPTKVEEQLRAMTSGQAPILCPLCSRFPQQPTTGICRTCHLKALADAHRERTSIDEAQRELWTQRQRKKREGRTKPRAVLQLVHEDEPDLDPDLFDDQDH